ncbi:MAG: hypothetical protein ACLTBF_07840 [Christensenellales bacterium]
MDVHIQRLRGKIGANTLKRCINTVIGSAAKENHESALRCAWWRSC